MTPPDAGPAASLIRTAFQGIPVPLDPPASAVRLTEAALLDHLVTGSGLVFEDGGLLGCTLLQVRPGGLYLGRLAVDAAHRGRGIAARLVEAAADQARAQGLGKLLLEVRLTVTSNRRLFARLGFREVAVHCHPGYAVPTFAEAERLL